MPKKEGSIVPAELERKLFDQTKAGILWDSQKPENVVVAHELSKLEIKNIVTYSKNVLRQEIGRQLSQAVGVEYSNHDTLDIEMTWREYLSYCQSRCVTPDVQSFQAMVTISKATRLPDIKDYDTGLMLVQDTVVMPGVGMVIERPKSDADAEYQIKRISSGVLYVVANTVGVVGLGRYYGISTTASHLLPTRMAVGGSGEVSTDQLKDMMIRLYESKKYPLVPGTLSHMVPEMQPYVRVALANDPIAHTNILAPHLFVRPNRTTSFADYAPTFPVDVPGSVRHYNVHGLLTPFHEKSFLDLDDPMRATVGATISGCSQTAHEVAIKQWLWIANNNFRIGGDRFSGYSTSLHSGRLLMTEIMQ